MKITKIEAIPFSIPYRKPLSFASGQVTDAAHVLVRVHTDDGLVGTAEAPPRPFTYGETQASIVGVIPVGHVFVDGMAVGDIGDLAIKDRLILGEEGLL